MKKYISLLVALIFFCSSLCFNGYAMPGMPEPLFRTFNDVIIDKYNKDDIVTFIVEVEGNPVFADDMAAAMGADYLQTDHAQKREDEIINQQSTVLNTIKGKSRAKIVPEATYTLLFNGFAIKAPYGDIEKIKAIKGVKNVYMSEDIKLEPHLADTADIIGTSSAELGKYTGKGQLVAVIDTEFQVNHPFFSANPEEPKIKSSGEMEAFLKDRGLDADVSASQVYKSQKVPFAYDYGENDYDLSYSGDNHGTHVAGIVGGKGGVGAGGNEINGIAPDSQLVLMKVTKIKKVDNIDTFVFSTESVFSALQDAVRLGVCAVNCSFGAAYISPDTDALWKQNLDAAAAAGVYVVASAGNDGRGFYKQSIKTENIDYSAIGVPAALPRVTSVAAATKSSEMRNDSSYGVTETLQLSPDITAPGNSIYSSVSNNSYTNKNGTSQASPHIAGVVAVMNEYFDENMLKASNTEQRVERNKLIKNMMMSTADILKQSNGVAYTPRVQGAGMINAAAAVSTPVILVNSDGESKLSLGDELTHEINISFIAKNMTEKAVTYDKLTLNVMTDGYTSSGGKNYVSESVKLTVISNTLPSEITIGNKEEKIIEAKITLDSEQLDSNSDIFENGFFIDGFISYEDSQNLFPHINIPFMGFYGDWTKATVFDTTLYDEGGSSLVSETKGGCTAIYDAETKVIKGNDGTGKYDSKYIAISPNDDSKLADFGLQITPMRTMSVLNSTVYDDTGAPCTSTLSYPVVLNKFNTYGVELNDISELDDGKYTLNINALYNYEKENPTLHTKKIPFYIDRVAPEILSAEKDGNIVNITFKDNVYVSYGYIWYNSVYGEPQYVQRPLEGEAATLSFDLTSTGAEDAAYEDIYVFVHDKAENYYLNSLSCLMGNIHSSPYFVYSENKINIELTNRTNAQTCTVVIAFYDNSGELVYMDKKEEYLIPEGGSYIEFQNLANLDSATKFKLFFWNNINEISPIDISKTFSLN